MADVERCVSQLVAALDSYRAFSSGASPAPAGTLRVEVHRGLDLGSEDERALDALVESRPEVGLFVSKAWLSGFFAEPQPDVEPALVIFRAGASVRGLVPIAMTSTLTHVRVAILGGGLGSDRVDVLATRGFESGAADAFLSWLRETFGAKGFLLELRDVAATSSLWGAIHRAGVERTQRLVLQPREIHTLPSLRLHELGDIAPDAPAAGSLRSLEKHRRWLERRCRLTAELLDNMDAVGDAFESLIRFLRARWRGRGEGSVLDDPRMVRLHRHVLPLLLKSGRLRMIRISAESRTVAVFYGVAAGGWWGYYLAGYDREWAGRIHLGRVTLATAIEHATREGAHEFDFLKGSERIKYSWPVRERATVDADVYSERCGVQLTRASRATREAAAALTKSARALFWP
jgi:CelD/BcsL family acetyltransferase involved in cellulose biosynthesis